MKILHKALLILSLATSAFADTEWAYSAEQGEDATSTFYYFFESSGDTIVRVRSVWNGGAQNHPTVTDYVIGSGAIRITEMEGDRKSIPDLIAGRDAVLKTTSDFKIACEHTGKMLIPPPPDKTLTDEQCIQIHNLISLLAIDRKLIIKKTNSSERATPSKPSD